MLQTGTAMQEFLDRHPAIKARPRRTVRPAKSDTADRPALVPYRQPDDVADGATFAASLADRLAMRKPCAAMLFAIDGLADIGERYGDAIASEVVDQFAYRLYRLEPLAGCLARLSDDVFALLVTEVSHAGEAEAIALRFMRALEQPFMFGATGLCISASIGIAVAPLHGRDAATLSHAASTALDLARARGGSVWQVSDSVCPEAQACATSTVPQAVPATGRVHWNLRPACQSLFTRMGAATRSAMLGAATSLLMQTPAAGMTTGHVPARHSTAAAPAEQASIATFVGKALANLAAARRA
jgi:GGDEF domain-containing protein